MPTVRAQRTLTVGRPGDRCEREADRIADALVAAPSDATTSVAQPADDLDRSAQPTSCPACPRSIRRQPVDTFAVPDEDDEPLVQLKAEPGGAPKTAPRPAVDGQLRGGRPLPAAVRAPYETQLGASFADVRVHTDAAADVAARRLQARAFTLGNQIAFRAGAYAPTTRAGRHLLAHELVHVVQQRPSARAPVVQRKACNFFVYDDTEGTKLETAWKYAAYARAAAVRGGYVLGSSHTIEYMLGRILHNFDAKDCDCIEEIQFWSHGSPGDSMYITKTGDELTIADFTVPGLGRFSRHPSFWEIAMRDPYAVAWQQWFDKLSWRHQRLVQVRSLLCGDAEIYYRSCSTFQGEEGKAFAKASATFWQSKVIGHTKLIGLTQPGRRELEPGQEPSWPTEEGAENEFKLRGKKGTTKPK